MSASSEFRPKARRPRGFMDRRGAALAHERDIVEKVLGVYQAWGFERLETSAFEYADALGKFLPDQDRPNEGVFALTDDDEQWMALRYDLTAPLARFVAENYDALPKPYRRCAAGPVWRNEKPGPGRFREFWQCDADTVGAASPAADAEMIAMACAALEAAGVARGKYRLKVSDRRLLDALLDLSGIADNADGRKQRLTAMRAIDKFDRLGRDGVEALLTAGRRDESGDFTPGAGLVAVVASDIVDFIDNVHAAGSRPDDENANLLEALERRFRDSSKGLAAVESLRHMHAFLTRLGVTWPHWTIDTSIVRGLEYYTGAVFEAELLIETKDEDGRPIRFGSVGGGGRYDDLVSRFKGTPIPATGFSIGVSRLAAALAHVDTQSDFAGPLVVLPFAAEGMGQCFEIAAELRNAFAHPAEVYLGGSGPKAQLKYADKRAAPVAVILGGDELAAGSVTLKDLRLGATMAASAGDDREAYQALREKVQVTVPRSEMIAKVREMLGRGS